MVSSNKGYTASECLEFQQSSDPRMQHERSAYNLKHISLRVDEHRWSGLSRLEVISLLCSKYLISLQQHKHVLELASQTHASSEIRKKYFYHRLTLDTGSARSLNYYPQDNTLKTPSIFELTRNKS